MREKQGQAGERGEREDKSRETDGGSGIEDISWEAKVI